MFGFPCLVQACPFQFFDLEFHGKSDGKTCDNLLEAGVSLSLQRMGKEKISFSGVLHHKSQDFGSFSGLIRP